ncbi:MAG: hypothetical protein ACI9UU_000991 [Candidatus Azotimanducaceae bacterium]|jgi:hypothetical protein
MNRFQTRLGLSLVVGLFAIPALGTEYYDCNMNGLDKMSESQADHVFFSRLGNNGKGNGGESIDVTFDAGVVIDVTCVGTTDEDTSGALTIPSLGMTFDPSAALSEIDPGR